ncbi:MAG: hypothetical protein ACK4ND_01935, partial [Cytophagaceae bacterium]
MTSADSLRQIPAGINMQIVRESCDLIIDLSSKPLENRSRMDQADARRSTFELFDKNQSSLMIRNKLQSQLNCQVVQLQGFSYFALDVEHSNLEYIEQEHTSLGASVGDIALWRNANGDWHIIVAHTARNKSIPIVEFV